jgi:ATP:corrinoid adenosyltransferase
MEMITATDEQIAQDQQTVTLTDEQKAQNTTMRAIANLAENVDEGMIVIFDEISLGIDLDALSDQEVDRLVAEKITRPQAEQLRALADKMETGGPQFCWSNGWVTIWKD